VHPIAMPACVERGGARQGRRARGGGAECNDLPRSTDKIPHHPFDLPVPRSAGGPWVVVGTERESASPSLCRCGVCGLVRASVSESLTSSIPFPSPPPPHFSPFDLLPSCALAGCLVASERCEPSPCVSC
jgi:hypothetical protein